MFRRTKGLTLVFIVLLTGLQIASLYPNTPGENLFLTKPDPLKECVHDFQPPPLQYEEPEFGSCFQEATRTGNIRHPEQYMRTNELIESYGYQLKTYDNITTQDGYILKLFRIPGGPRSPERKGKPAVLLYHGMAMTSDQWLILPGNKNLAFKLADAGYDVFLANSRGTDFSRGHLKLNHKVDFQYWDFSFHEMGIYDFPSILDVILSETGSEKIFFIGHSMGASTLAVALSESPQLNQRIRASFLLAPSIFIGHMYSPHRFGLGLLELPLQMQSFINRMLGGRILDGNPVARVSPMRFCTPSAIKCGMCRNYLFYLYGYDAPQINVTNIPNIIAKTINSCSVKTLQHFGQNFRSCMFRKFDYGPQENLLRYGTVQPPSYNLSKIIAPTYIYYGEADSFVPAMDVQETCKALPTDTLKGCFRVNWKLFNHVDFIIAKDADLLVYNSIVDIMNSFKN